MESDSNNTDKIVPQSSSNNDPKSAGTENYEIDSDWAGISRLSQKSWTEDNAFYNDAIDADLGDGF